MALSSRFSDFTRIQASTLTGDPIPGVLTAGLFDNAVSCVCTNAGAGDDCNIQLPPTIAAGSGDAFRYIRWNGQGTLTLQPIVTEFVNDGAVNIPFPFTALATPLVVLVVLYARRNAANPAAGTWDAWSMTPGDHHAPYVGDLPNVSIGLASHIVDVGHQRAPNVVTNSLILRASDDPLLVVGSDVNGHVALGNDAGAGTGLSGAGQSRVFVGSGAGNAAIGAGNDAIGIGRLALAASLVTVDSAIAIGVNAGQAATLGANDILIGTGAAQAATLVGADNIIIGRNAGTATTSSGADCISVGQNAGNAGTTLGADCISIGRDAAAATAAVGADCVAIGRSALDAIGAVSANVVAIGLNAASNAVTVGADGVFIGVNAGGGTFAVGDDCIGIGENALNAGAAAGIGNIGIGVSAGAAGGAVGTNNICLGLNAGTSAGALGNDGVFPDPSYHDPIVHSLRPIPSQYPKIESHKVNGCNDDDDPVMYVVGIVL